MGGSAGGNSNAQIFQLMSQYGGDGSGNSAARKGPSKQQMFQSAFENYIKNHPNGSTGIFAGFDFDRGGGYGNAVGGGGGGKKNPKPPVNPPTQAEKFQWQFPQYTQTWAFTPPEPTPYMYPQPFNTNIFGNPLPKEKKK